MGRKVSRRKFVKWALGSGAAIALGGCGGGAAGHGPGKTAKPGAATVCKAASSPPPPVVFIAIDSFAPSYLDLDDNGEWAGAGSARLTPNLHAFLTESTRFEHTRCYLPAATDMNHLNTIAGTSSGQTGIIGVSVQLQNWRDDGQPILVAPSLWEARDDQGRPVETLFRAWKRKWPCSRTAYVSGKAWIGEMYRTATMDVDVIAHGVRHPAYVPVPEARSFYDPPGDPDAETDVESLMQKQFAEQVLMSDPEHFPADSWLVDGALEILRRESPDLAVILLAQLDDVQHALGAASNPDEFVDCPLGLCGKRSDRNFLVYREPILDAVRDVDDQFGVLIQSIRGMARYQDATIVLYSDHGHLNHQLNRSWRPGDPFPQSTDVVSVLQAAGEISAAEAEGSGLAVVSGCSMGAIHFKGSVAERASRARSARDVLVAHEARHPKSLEYVTPWDVLTQDDMRDGVPGLTAPGELWHEYFGNRSDSVSQLWPDLSVLMRDGWQIPIYGNMLGNLGYEFDFVLPPLTVFVGGHGAPDTQDVLFAMQGPGIASGRTVSDPGFSRNHRLADAAVTVAEMFDLELRHTTVGLDRTGDLS